jgi:hypothetical protein
MSDERTLKARCPCGQTIVVDGAEDGQTLYGSLGFKMARHEPCPALSRTNPWQFIHATSIPDSPLGDT